MRRRSDPNHPSWSEKLLKLQIAIEDMACGPDKDDAERRVGQLKAAIQMEGWLKSSELKPPTSSQKQYLPERRPA